MSRIIFLIALIIINANGALSKKTTENRVIGGVNSRIEDFPYQVALEVEGNHLCGGSIISDRFIVTAGHCIIEELTPQDMKVRVGATWKGKRGSVMSVKRFIPHEEYGSRDDFVPINDIALIELTRPIEFDRTRKPIKLFEANEKIPRHSKGVVSGWGDTGDNSYTGQLQHVMMPIVSRALCKKAYSNRPGQLEPYIPDGQICAGLLGVGGKDSCQGDSGGPLAIDGRLAGVVSWGQSCADPKFPGIYTEVAYYRDWIKNNAGI